MKAIKATFEGGVITLAEPAPGPGPVDVLVVFPDSTDDPWRDIFAEEMPRKSFLDFADECSKQIAHGKAKPLDIDKL